MNLFTSFRARRRKRLVDGSRVAVVGGGPAGSFFSYFLLEAGRRVGLNLHVDIYEPRNFHAAGPAGCNNCGGVISQTLMQSMAAEGIHLPPAVVQRCIDSYVLHTDAGRVLLPVPHQEKKIAVVHRGAGPLNLPGHKWQGFDDYIQSLVLARGAHLLHSRVEDAARCGFRIKLRTHDGWAEPYDLVAVAAGLHAATLRLFEALGGGYRSPRCTRTYISEFPLAGDALNRHLGDAMHLFLLNVPRLEFAALVPKGDCVTVCLLGRNIDRELIHTFLDHPQVRECLPAGYTPPERCCHCSPLINVAGARRPFAGGLVFIGDSAFTRLYKDGMGAAFRTARAAALTAVHEGIDAAAFRRRYWPECRSIAVDNRYGKVIFCITARIKRRLYSQRGLLRMVRREQSRPRNARRMSSVLWDTFTGSAPYRNVFLRTLHPVFLARFCVNAVLGFTARARNSTISGI